MLNEWWVDIEHSCIWSKQENGAKEVLWQDCECLSHLLCARWPQRLQGSFPQLLIPPWKLQPAQDFDIPALILPLSSNLWIVFDDSSLKEGSTAEQTLMQAVKVLCDQPGSEQPNHPGAGGDLTFCAGFIAAPINAGRFFSGRQRPEVCWCKITQCAWRIKKWVSRNILQPLLPVVCPQHRF